MKKDVEKVQANLLQKRFHFIITLNIYIAIYDTPGFEKNETVKNVIEAIKK